MRTYWKALLVLVAMALVMAVDGVALVAVLLTFGLAFPLVFAATGALALLCLYPAVRGWKDNRVRGVLLSAALATIVFAGPAIVGDWQARRLVAVATSADVAPPAMPENPGSLEIRRPSSGHDGLFEGSGACGSECRALLRSGRVDWVRVVMLDMRGKPLDEQPVRVRLGRGDDCAAPGFAADGGDTCILQSADDGAPAGLVLSFETGSGKRVEGLTDRGFAGPRRIWRVTARRPGDAAPVLRRTAVEIRRPAMPAIVGPEFNGMNSEGIRFQQTARRHGDVSLSATLAALGLAVNPAAIAEERTAAVRTRGEPPSAATTRSMVAVLDLPQAAPFSRDQARPVAQWVMQARAIRDWTPERTALFRRVLRDRRIQSPTFADQIFARNPDLARQMLPDLLEVLETDDGEAVYTQARRIAYSLADIDPALLAPHATRLAALARRDDRTGHAVLLAAGRLGIDPRPLLVPFAGEGDARGASALVRLRAACRAEDRWGEALVPPLKDALRDVRGTPGFRRDFVDAAARALARFGETDHLRATLPGLGWDERRIENTIRRAGRESRNGPDC